MNSTYYFIVRDIDEYWNEDRELKYLDMVRNGRAKSLINDKDLMNRITRETIEHDEESGLSIAEVNWTEEEREVGVFIAFKVSSTMCSIPSKHWPIFKVNMSLACTHIGI